MTTFEYKYVIVDKYTSEIRRWEALPDHSNRIMTVKQKGTFSASEREGILQTKINKIKLNRSLSGLMKSKFSGYNKINPKIRLTNSVSHTHVAELRSKRFKSPKKTESSVRNIKIPKISQKVEVETNFLNIGLTKIMTAKKLNSYNKLGDPQDYEENKLISSQESSSDDEGNHKASSVIKNIKELEQRVLSYQDITEFAKLNIPATPFERIQENLDGEIDNELSDNDCVIIVAIRLPFELFKNAEGKLTLRKTTSLLYSKFYGRDPDNKIEEWWIGW
jgi:hypothetical protein